MNNGSIVLSGRYEVGELVGRGGMAEVHIGHDTRLGRTVAIKILRSDLARDPSFLARFRREAQAAASLNHPAIVAVYDTGEDIHTDATGAEVHVPFIVMEYVEGHTVREVLRDGQAVPIDEAIEITAGVLAALEYSHHAGIVHRDIKPANVMITPTGAVKVMDFGIARAVADSAATMTQTQAVIGTAQYLSPEQARGETVDARSDLYSTGCLLFELLTGRPPFIGDSPVAVAYQHVREAPPIPSSIAPDVPEVLDRITLMALTKDRDDRYSTAAEFRADLENALRGGHVAAPALAMATMADDQPTMLQTAPIAEEPPSPWAENPVAPTPPPTGEDDGELEKPKNRRALMWTLIAVAAVALIAILFFWLANRDPGDPAPETTTVPEIAAGMSRTDAEAKITAAGLTMEPVTEQSADQPADTATGTTDPVSGTEVNKGTAVKVTFFVAPDSEAIPTVEGKSQDEARKALDDAGFTVGSVTTENHPTIKKDQAIRTDPAAGSTHPAGTAVVLVLSSGMTTVPDVVGKSQTDAEAMMKAANLEPRVEKEASADVPAGNVIRQSTAGDRSLKQGDFVTITVATAPEPTKVQVPDITRKSYEEAARILRDAGFVASQLSEASDEIRAGQAIRSEPGVGTSLAAGSPVAVVISTGPEQSD